VSADGGDDPELSDAVTEKRQGVEFVTVTVHEAASMTRQLFPGGLDETA